jgi:hypothetical protein
MPAHLAAFGVVVSKGGQNGRKVVPMMVAGETFGLPPLAVPVLLATFRCSTRRYSASGDRRGPRHRAC